MLRVPFGIVVGAIWVGFWELRLGGFFNESDIFVNLIDPVKHSLKCGRKIIWACDQVTY